MAADGPGFLVNRCGRPFYTEALRLLQERVATHEQIDRICRLGAGFRMGPFELMDMVGIDVGFEVAKSFDALSFGEPRWKPNPIQERMARGGRLGRKTGRGYYDYASGGAPPAGPRAAGAGRRREPRDHDRRRGAARWRDGLARTRPGAAVLRGARPSPASRCELRARSGLPPMLAVRRPQPARVRTPRRRRLPPRAARRGVAARRADRAAQRAGRPPLGAPGLSRRVGGGRAGPRARPDRRAARERGRCSRSARAWARRRTSTPGSSSG